MRRFLLLLALSIIVATLFVFGVGMASAEPPEGAGCKGLLKAAKASGKNPQVEENAFEHGCFDVQSPPPPKAAP
jgi:hypothetical protein